MIVYYNVNNLRIHHKTFNIIYSRNSVEHKTVDFHVICFWTVAMIVIPVIAFGRLLSEVCSQETLI